MGIALSRLCAISLIHHPASRRSFQARPVSSQYDSLCESMHLLPSTTDRPRHCSDTSSPLLLRSSWKEIIYVELFYMWWSRQSSGMLSCCLSAMACWTRMDSFASDGSCTSWYPYLWRTAVHILLWQRMPRSKRYSLTHRRLKYEQCKAPFGISSFLLHTLPGIARHISRAEHMFLLRNYSENTPKTRLATSNSSQRGIADSKIRQGT